MLSREDLIRWGFRRVSEGVEEIKALCPFHHETNPSFSINKRTGLWYCFGCGRGGNLKQLLDKLQIKEENPLLDWRVPPKKQRGETKLQLEGNILIPTKNPFLRRFDILYCVQGHLRGRFLIPIDETGYFEARSFDDKLTPKVLYLPKGAKIKECVFNISRIKPQKEVYIVEGIKDALSMISKGFPNTVSIFGAKLYDEQLRRLLKRGVTELIFCFDNDRTGLSGLVKAYYKTSPFSPKMIILPPKLDPASTPKAVLKELKPLPIEEDFIKELEVDIIRNRKTLLAQYFLRYVAGGGAPAYMPKLFGDHGSRKAV